MEGVQALDVREEFDDVRVVVNLIVPQIQTLQRRQKQKIFTIFGIWNNIALQIKIPELVKAFETLDLLDSVHGQVDGDQLLEHRNVFYFADRILMQVNHLKLLKGFETFYLLYSIAFQPYRLQIGVRGKMFDFAESFVVEVERIVQRWSRVLTILFAKLTDVFLRQ